MTEFDFKKAWKETILPKWEDMDYSLKLAIFQASEIVKERPQRKKDLNIEYTPDLKKLFENFKIDALAESSHIVYFLGHWFPYEIPLDEFSKAYNLGNLLTHSTWKVSNILDQILAERLGIENRPEKHPSCQFFYNGVHQGKLRVAYSSLKLWTWVEVCWATHLPSLPCTPIIEREAEDLLNGWSRRLNDYSETFKFFNIERYLT